jgi:hypothetical protein
MTHPHTAVCLVGMLLLGFVVGCDTTELETLQADLRAARRTVDDLQRDNDDLTDALAQRDERITTLVGLGENRLENIPHVARVELGRHTAGTDIDGVDGDDAMKVYITPIDQDGTAIKAAGEVTLQLYDLAAGPDDTFLGEYKWSVEELRKRWSSGFMSYHYSLECPWLSGPPANDEITVRVTFVDYLTGKTFTAQMVGPVELADAPAE